jgi:hypothetical protein
VNTNNNQHNDRNNRKRTFFPVTSPISDNGKHYLLVPDMPGVRIAIVDPFRSGSSGGDYFFPIDPTGSIGRITPPAQYQMFGKDGNESLNKIKKRLAATEKEQQQLSARTIAKFDGVGEKTLKALEGAGLVTPQLIHKASIEGLKTAGVHPSLIKQILKQAQEVVDSDKSASTAGKIISFFENVAKNSYYGLELRVYVDTEQSEDTIRYAYVTSDSILHSGDISIVSQHGEFFLSVQEIYRMPVCQKGTELLFPELEERRPQFCTFFREQLSIAADIAVTPITAYKEKTPFDLKQLRNKQAIVDYFSVAQRTGRAILLSRNTGKPMFVVIHYSEIENVEGIARLDKGDIITFEGLTPIQSTSHRKVWEGHKFQAVGVRYVGSESTGVKNQNHKKHHNHNHSKHSKPGAHKQRHEGQRTDKGNGKGASSHQQTQPNK